MIYEDWVGTGFMGVWVGTSLFARAYVINSSLLLRTARAAYFSSLKSGRMRACSSKAVRGSVSGAERL